MPCFVDCGDCRSYKTLPKNVFQTKRQTTVKKLCNNKWIKRSKKCGGERLNRHTKNQVHSTHAAHFPNAFIR